MAEKEYLELFIDEVRDYISSLNELLVRISEGDENAVKEALRLMHSIKGNSGMLNLRELSELAHTAEDVLVLIRDKKVGNNLEEIVNKLFKAIDIIDEAIDNLDKYGKISEDVRKRIADTTEELRRLVSEKQEAGLNIKADEALRFIKSLNEGGNKPDVSKLLGDVTEKLNSILTASEERRVSESTDKTANDELLKLNEEELRKAAEIVKRGLHLYRVILKFRDDPSMLVFRYFVALSKLGELGEIVKSVPSGKEVMHAKTSKFEVLIGIRKLSELEDKSKELPNLESYEVIKLRPEDLGITEEMLSKVSGGGISTDKVAAIEELLKKAEESDDNEETSYEADKKIEEVRVNVRSLDKLFNLVGELVLIKSRLSTIASKHSIPGLREALTIFSRLVNELQDEVMRMRLIPLQYLFRNIPRFINELASRYGKKVDVYIEGEDISLDRKVLEELAKPLYTLLEVLIRDDVEEPAERRRKGKDEVATLHIRAAREGNYVTISIGSDGRGIDTEEVRKRVVELGLIPSSVVNKMSTNEVLTLIMMPGFSLKNGELSGLDNIKKSIESLGGSVEVYTKLDTETKFIFKIPVSMATLRALLIRLNNEVFAIPVSSVVTTLRLKNSEYLGRLKVIKYHNNVVPLYDLAHILNIDGDGGDRSYAVIVEKRGKLIALAVDDILDQDDVVVKPVSKVLSKVKGVSGATILGGGKVCLILDVQSLIG